MVTNLVEEVIGEFHSGKKTISWTEFKGLFLKSQHSIGLMEQALQK